MQPKAYIHYILYTTILFAGIETGAIFVDIGEFTVAEDAGFGVRFLQAAKQHQQGLLLLVGPCVGMCTVLIKSTFVANAEAMLVVASGMGADELLMARLVGLAVAGYVVVVTRKTEPFHVTTDERCHGKVLVTARGRTVNHNQINLSHDCTQNELTIAVRMVMMNWMMFFQLFMSLSQSIFMVVYFF